jgi:hypothetical protein
MRTGINFGEPKRILMPRSTGWLPQGSRSRSNSPECARSSPRPAHSGTPRPAGRFGKFSSPRGVSRAVSIPTISSTITGRLAGGVRRPRSEAILLLGHGTRIRPKRTSSGTIQWRDSETDLGGRSPHVCSKEGICEGSCSPTACMAVVGSEWLLSSAAACFGGRWNSVGAPTIYAARELSTAWAEYNQGFVQHPALIAGSN